MRFRPSSIIFHLIVSTIVGLAFAAPASVGWKEKVLYSFQGGDSDGAVPVGSVVLNASGNLYGATTDGGGRNCGNPFQCGTVYQLQPPAKKGDPWTETVLYIFKGIPSGDAATPSGGLLIDKSGNLYGATGYGGSGNCQLLGGNVGCGTVFELSPPKTQGGAWTETILYSFQGNTDGQLPIGDLVFDQQGNLYGSTAYGGGYGSCNPGFYQHCGTVFKLSPPKTKNGKWKEQVLYSFKSGKDGANPNGGLVLDGKGVIYGTTQYGGGHDEICKTDSGTGCGTVFKLKPSAKGVPWKEEVLYRFKAGKDGAAPNGNLKLDSANAIYGTTFGGGHENGTVFRLSPPTRSGGPWTETLLFVFQTCGDKDGCSPGPIIVSHGNLYGAAGGGASHSGLLFRVKPPKNGSGNWSYSVLYAFTGPPDGYSPNTLVLGDKGSINGITQFGGAGQFCQGGCGTVFETNP